MTFAHCNHEKYKWNLKLVCWNCKTPGMPPFDLTVKSSCTQIIFILVEWQIILSVVCNCSESLSWLMVILLLKLIEYILFLELLGLLSAKCVQNMYIFFKYFFSPQPSLSFWIRSQGPQIILQAKPQLFHPSSPSPVPPPVLACWSGSSTWLANRRFDVVAQMKACSLGWVFTVQHGAAAGLAAALCNHGPEAHRTQQL